MPSSLTRSQETRRPPGSSRRAGASVRHRSVASGQRVWKRQPGGGVQRAGELAVQHDAFAGALLDRVGDRRGGEQRLGVQVFRGGEQLGGRGLSEPVVAPGRVAEFEDHLTGIPITVGNRAHPRAGRHLVRCGTHDTATEHKALGEPDEGLVACRVRIAMHDAGPHHDTQTGAAFGLQIT